MAPRKAPPTAFKKGQSGNPAGRKPGPNKVTKEIRDLARGILERPKALAILQKQADEGKLHPSIHVTLMHYAYGKPKTEVEISGGSKAVKFVVSVPRPGGA